MLLLRTASGGCASITNSRRAVYGYDQRIEVFGAKGMLRAGNLDADHRLALRRRVHVRRQSLAELPDALRRGLRGRAVVLHPQRRAPQAGRVPLEDTRRVLLLREAAQKSATTGKPVKVTKN